MTFAKYYTIVLEFKIFLITFVSIWSVHKHFFKAYISTQIAKKVFASGYCCSRYFIDSLQAQMVIKVEMMRKIVHRMLESGNLL